MTVNGGETVDMGILPLTGWFTDIEGYVFNDTNRNGRRDAGEAGVPNFGLTVRKRENSLMDRGVRGDDDRPVRPLRPGAASTR